MSAIKRKLPSGILIGLILVICPALIRAQGSTVSWSSVNMAFALSSSPNTTAKSAAGQVFLGRAEGADTRIESGYYGYGVARGSALALDETDGLPSDYALRQNYPNPFNPVTTIQFELPKPTAVYLVVYDLLGREVRHLVQGQKGPGYHKVLWNGKAADGRDAPAGIYIARLLVPSQAGMTPEYAKSIKMLLLK
ncbi:MAG: FlgD immunoglobulin-like domain containing protein [Candidatus Neomarinimicrobiota bacterium]